MTVDRTRVSMLVRNPFTNDSRVEKEARTLAGAGYAVTVVADHADGLPVREERDGYRVLRVPRAARGAPGLRFLATGRRLLRALIGTRPDILHAHDSDALASVAAAAARLRVPFVHDAHELWLGQLRRGRGTAYWAAFLAWYRLIERRHLGRASAWLAATEPIARHLERTYRLPRVETLMNLPELDGPGAPRSIRSLPGGERIPDGAPIILYLGGLLPGRGIEQLVQALPEIQGAHLVLLGRGMQGPVALALAQRLAVGERVHLFEPVAPAEVIAYAASASVGVSPIQPLGLSYRYSLPNKLFECMAAGIPVVASDFPQVREVVEGSGAGICVDPTDPVAIARAIGELLAGPERAAAMGRAGRAAVEARYNWSASARVLLDVYAALPRRSPGSRASSAGETSRKRNASGR